MCWPSCAGRGFACAVALLGLLVAPGPFAGWAQAVPVSALEAAVEAAEASPAWRRYAALSPEAAGRPMVAIVIDDLGHDPLLAARAIALDPRITLAFLPYTPSVEQNVWLARRARHEILVHLPLEPMCPDADPGPNALFTDLDGEEMIERLQWNLTQFEGYVGVNGHMGSKFTRDMESMEALLGELKRRGLLYLDSRTISDSVGVAVAEALGVPYAQRDVFIDHEPQPEAIARQLERLEEIAAEKGAAVGIGHPLADTFEALESWFSELEERGYVLVPLSAIVERNAVTSASGS